MKDKYMDIAMELIEKYNVKCYKKNENDKLYSFIFQFIESYIYKDIDIDRFICQRYRFTLKELRLVKKYLRLYCELIYFKEGRDDKC